MVRTEKQLEQTIRIELGSMFNHLQERKEEKNHEEIVEIKLEKPKITAKEIASRLECSLYGAQYKLRVLSKNGRIRFSWQGW